MRGGRGRPRSFDTEVALERMTAVFWETGYSGTSLDRLSEAAGVTRPSLYAAYGDKKALYLAAMQAFNERLREIAQATLIGREEPASELLAYFDACLSVYTGAGDGRGCFVVCTSLAETAADPDIRRAVANTIKEMDEGLLRFFEAAQKRGDLPRHVKPSRMAWMGSAFLHSAAIRARAGMPPHQIRSAAKDAVAFLLAVGASSRARSEHGTRGS